MSANPVPPGPNRPIWATWVLPIAGLLLLAAAITFLLSPDASFCCGSVLFVDGGTDALLRPDEARFRHLG